MTGELTRRSVLGAAAGSAAVSVVPGPSVAAEGSFPRGFLWGAATAAHQVEGNNIGSDAWVLENVASTYFSEPSGDADNSLELWPTDLDLVREIGLNTYRFSLEWARVEPERGQFSIAMLDHYKRMVEGCHKRGLTPVVTFNHFTTPRWFAAAGGWVSSDAPDLFARFCDQAARHVANGIAYAATLNEPNVAKLLTEYFSQPVLAQYQQKAQAADAAAAKSVGSNMFGDVFIQRPADMDIIQEHQIAGHKAGKSAIKAIRADLPVGVTLAMMDDEAVGAESARDARRAAAYGAWLQVARSDDFLGVQNYTRVLWGKDGPLPPPADAKLNGSGQEIFPPSLANAVRYAYQTAKIPVLVTEHGVGTDDDTLRAWLIPAALSHLRELIHEGVPVKGYIHWSLLDNFEWMFGFKSRYGLCAVDRTTFRRTRKPSSFTLGHIARRNSV